MSFSLNLGTAEKARDGFLTGLPVRLMILQPGMLRESWENFNNLFGRTKTEKVGFFDRSPEPGTRAFYGEFPEPGRVRTYIDDIGEGFLPPFIVDVWGSVGHTEFGLSELSRNDTLTLISSGRHVSGAVIHAASPRVHACVVRCADGRSSQTCIVCRHGDVVVKICC
jgi:hypothetical protein